MERESISNDKVQIDDEMPVKPEKPFGMSNKEWWRRGNRERHRMQAIYLKKAARYLTPRMLDRLVEIANQDENLNAACRAIEQVLDRAWGKSTNNIEMGVKHSVISRTPMTAEEWFASVHNKTKVIEIEPSKDSVGTAEGTTRVPD